MFIMFARNRVKSIQRATPVAFALEALVVDEEVAVGGESALNQPRRMINEELKILAVHHLQLLLFGEFAHSYQRQMYTRRH